MSYQIGYNWRGNPFQLRKVFIYVEPNTYYPAKESAEKDIPRIEKELPSLKGILQVVET